MRDKRAMSNYVVIALVIVAIVLAFFSISYNLNDAKTESSGDSSSEDSAGGRVGIEIVSQGVEDRGLEGYGG